MEICSIVVIKVDMKRILVLYFFLLFASINSVANDRSMQMEERISLQFIIKTLDVLQKVAPEQKDGFLKYDKEIKNMLLDARALKREHHSAEQKGFRGKEDVEKTRKKGELLLEKALLRTEDYLQSILNGLKKHRQSIKSSLFPK